MPASAPKTSIFTASAASILVLPFFVGTVSAQSLDHCPSIDNFGPQTSPHCVQQREFCVDWSMTPYYMIVEAKRFDDPLDLIADMSIGGRVFGDTAAMLSAMGPKAYTLA